MSMYKQLVEKYLRLKVDEADSKSHPGITITNSIKEKNGKINKEATKDTEKNMKDLETSSAKEGKDAIVPPKTNIEGASKKYHDEIELSEDNLDLTYDMLEVPEKFKDRAKKSIEGDSTMGNKVYTGKDNGNTESVWGASKDNFGKDLVKNKVNRVKDTSQSVEGSGSNGKAAGITHDETALAKRSSKGEKGATTPFTTKKKDATTEGIGADPVMDEAKAEVKPISEKNKMVLTNWVEKLGAKESAVKLVNTLSQTGLVSDLPDSNEYGQGVNGIEALLAKGNFDQAVAKARALAKRLEKKAMKGMWEGKENNNNKITENKMKRLRFKTPFNGMSNAISVIPEAYKVANKEFEMTDGNETYKVRWEGSLTEGKAVVLQASNQQFVNEDVNKIKHLMNYKPENTLGTVKGKDRLFEDTKFKQINGKMKELAEAKDAEIEKKSL